jgi:hypothetical protein
MGAKATKRATGSGLSAEELLALWGDRQHCEQVLESFVERRDAAHAAEAEAQERLAELALREKDLVAGEKALAEERAAFERTQKDHFGWWASRTRWVDERPGTA